MTHTADETVKPGGVTLVGFGPGDPELLTIKAIKALQQAEIIYYDDLIDKEYLRQEFSGSAKLEYVGKRSQHHHAEQDEINEMLLKSAKEGKKVVRLKGGDPMIFGHAGEEIEYLESRGIAVNVIPGVTAASAFAAQAKTSLTLRHVASSVAFVNGHGRTISTPDADTLIYYMGGKNLKNIARRLTAQGLPAGTPVLLGYNVSQPDSKMWHTTLGGLIALPEGTVPPTPIIAMVGDTAGMGCHIKSENREIEAVHHCSYIPRFGDENTTKKGFMAKCGSRNFAKANSPEKE